MLKYWNGTSCPGRLWNVHLRAPHPKPPDLITDPALVWGGIWIRESTKVSFNLKYFVLPGSMKTSIVDNPSGHYLNILVKCSLPSAVSPNHSVAQLSYFSHSAPQYSKTPFSDLDLSFSPTSSVVFLLIKVLVMQFRHSPTVELVLHGSPCVQQEFSFY